MNDMYNYLCKHVLHATKFEWAWLLEKLFLWQNTILNKQENQQDNTIKQCLLYDVKQLRWTHLHILAPSGLSLIFKVLNILLDCNR